MSTPSSEHERLLELQAGRALADLSTAEQIELDALLEEHDEAGVSDALELTAAELEVEHVEEQALPATLHDRLLQASRDHASVRESGADEQVWRSWKGDSMAASLFTLRGGEGDWEETGVDGIQVRRLFIDQESKRMTALFRMAPGTAYPSHVHDGPEECFVLEGDLHVAGRVLHAGDYQRAPVGSLHGVQSTENGCLLLINSSISDELVA